MIKAIMYHYVRPVDNAYPHFTFLHVDDFRKQLDYFSKTYNIVHPDVLQDSIRKGECANGTVLTFDDGLKDHYRYVFPELKKRGLSAIFYISTGIFDNYRILGVHRLHLLLGRYGGKKIYEYLLNHVTDEMYSHNHVLAFSTDTYSKQVGEVETQQVKRMMNYHISYEYRQQVLDDMMSHFFGNEKELKKDFYVSDTEIKEMHDAGMVIGSHTVSHPVMSKLTPAEQTWEITASVNQLEEITGGLHHRTFCYPYGGFHTFTPQTEAILTGNRFSYSFNVEERDVCTADLLQRPQALPRLNCNLFPHGKIYSYA